MYHRHTNRMPNPKYPNDPAQPVHCVANARTGLFLGHGSSCPVPAATPVFTHSLRTARRAAKRMGGVVVTFPSITAAFAQWAPVFGPHRAPPGTNPPTGI